MALKFASGEAQGRQAWARLLLARLLQAPGALASSSTSRGRRQGAQGRGHEAGGTRQEAGGKRQEKGGGRLFAS